MGHKPLPTRIKREIAQWYENREAVAATKDAEATFTKERTNRNHRFACEGCQLVTWHGGIQPRGFCINCYELEGKLARFEYSPIKVVLAYVPRAKAVQS